MWAIVQPRKEVSGGQRPEKRPAMVGAILVDAMGSTAQRREVRPGERRGGSLSKTRRKDIKSDNRKKIQCEGKY